MLNVPHSAILFPCSHYQHGGYPLVQENNLTFPADEYRFERTDAHNLTFTDIGAIYVVNVTSPLAGRWFAGVYLNDLDNHEVVKKVWGYLVTILSLFLCNYSLLNL